jgi:transposase
MGEARREQARQRFHAWHRVRDATLTQAQFRGIRGPIRRAVARGLKAGQTCGVAKTEGGCREVLKGHDALGTFGRVEGVEPTNNAAERAMRPGVLWRKGSFGTQSAQESRFVEAMMTVVATLKQQHRNVLASMTEAGQAAYTGMPAPSLLPCHSTAEEDLPVAA